MNIDADVKGVSRKIDNIVVQIDKIKNCCSQMDKDCKRLNDAFTKSNDAGRLINQKLTEYEHNSAMKIKMLKWLDSLSEGQKSMNQSIKIINDVLINPGKRFSELFPPITLLNKRRDQLVVEIANLESKLQKYETKERTGPNLLKAHETKLELQKAMNNLSLINKTIIEDGELIINSTHPFFSISLKAHAKISFFIVLSGLLKSLVALCIMGTLKIQHSKSLMQSNLALFESLNKESLQISELFNTEVDLLKLGSTPEEHLNNRLNSIRSELSIVRNDNAVCED